MIVFLVGCGLVGGAPDEELVVLGYTHKQPPLADPIALFEGQDTPCLPKLLDAFALGMSEADGRARLEEVRERRVRLTDATAVELPEIAKTGVDRVISSPLAGWNQASLSLHVKAGVVVQLDLSLPKGMDEVLIARWPNGTKTPDYTVWTDDAGHPFCKVGPAGDRSLVLVGPREEVGD